MDEPVPGAPVDTSTLPGLYETLWTNGNIQILYHDYWNVDIAYTSTVGVAFSGNDVYVAAHRTTDSASKNSGGYFKNGSWNDINNGAFWPNSIYASGTDVYISGYTYTFPPYSNFQAAYGWISRHTSRQFEMVSDGSVNAATNSPFGRSRLPCRLWRVLVAHDPRDRCRERAACLPG